MDNKMKEELDQAIRVLEYSGGKIGYVAVNLADVFRKLVAWQASLPLATDTDAKPLPVAALATELAAHRAVFDAAKELNRLMNEVERDDAGQNDRVFAHFEFDQLRYAIGLVDNLKGRAEHEKAGAKP